MKISLLKVLTVIMFLTNCVIKGNAQTWQWANNGIGGNQNNGTSVCTDIRGNVYIAGAFSSTIMTFDTYSLTTPIGTSSTYLTKYDSNGNVLWAKSPIGESYGGSVCTDPLGNVYLAGNYNSPTICFDSYTLTNNTGDFVEFLAKYDSNGNVIWVKGGNNFSQVSSVSVDQNGNPFITGWFNNMISFGSFTLTCTYTLSGFGNKAAFLTKFDSNGNVLWARTADCDDSCTPGSVSIDPFGNAFISGHFFGHTAIFGNDTLFNSDPAASSSDIFIAKYDANGSVQWAKSAVGVNGYPDASYSISADIFGNAYITGFFYSPTIKFGSFTLNTYGSGDDYLTKYDPNGNVLWAKNFNGAGNEVGYSVDNDIAGNTYITGWTTGPTIAFDSHFLTFPSGSTYPMFVAKYDINGNATDAVLLLGCVSAHDKGIALDNNCQSYVTGTFFGSGSTNSFVIGTNTLTNTGNQTNFLAKLTFTTTDCIPISVTGISQLIKSEYQISVSPNPNNGLFKIQIDNDIQKGELIIINSLGQIVYRQVLNQGENNIITNKLSSGLYYYNIIQNKQQVGNGKLIIE